MEDPATFMNRDGMRVPCLIDPTRVARIDRDFSARLNWEIFFFADEAARERFWLDPLRWCGALTDPVTLQRFIPQPSSPKSEHAGQIYYFASEKSHAAFAVDPQKYITVPHYMIGETRKAVEERERRAAEKAAEQELERNSGGSSDAPAAR